MELKDLQEVMKVLKETDLRELEYEKDDIKLYMKKGYVAPKEIILEKIIEAPAKDLVDIKSLNVGKFFYNGLTIGQSVNKEDKLGYIESVGIKTNILSDTDGKIAEILVENGSIADYGKILIRIEKI